MASFVDLAVPGPVIEIGPGTGPVTEALIERGIDESRLILVEYSPEFCQLLRKRFPHATVIEGDAYALVDHIGRAPPGEGDRGGVQPAAVQPAEGDAQRAGK